MPRSKCLRLPPFLSNAAMKCTGQDDRADRQETTQSVSEQFPLFSKLPPELRHQVWNHAFQLEPRSVSVIYFRASPTTLRFRSKTRLPGAFHACREARAVGMSLYHHVLHDGIISKQSYVPPSKRYPKSSIKVLREWVQGLFHQKPVNRRPVEDDKAGPIYVNPGLDTVYLEPRDCADFEALMALLPMNEGTRCIMRTVHFNTYSYLISFCSNYTRTCVCGTCTLLI
jgi:hypothetical protein